MAGRLPAGIAGGMPGLDMVALGIDPRSIAGMDDAGLDVPATRIGKARDTVAALEGVTLPSAVDQVRRDTLKAMVGIHAGEKLPRDYARKARNKAMLDFMAASPALRESKLADQVGLLMDEISPNGKRAVGAYTALKGKMKGIEATNLPRLYDLKRELESDVNIGWHRKRSFVAAVDKEIENSTYRGDTPRAEDGPEEENAEAANVDPRSIADMDDSGLTGMVNIEELAAVEPKTYDEYMRYGKAISEVVGYSHIEQQRLATVLAGLRGVEANFANAPEGLDGQPSPRQQRALANARADAAGFYGVFVEKALARRNTPLDFPRTTSGAIDMSLVQPGFVYKTRDGVLFMVDPGGTKFAEARKLLKLNAEGRLYEPLASPEAESVSASKMMYRAKSRDPAVTHKIPMTKDGRVSVWDLDERVTYEVEDGTRFVWDGEKFREVLRLDEPDDEGRTYMPRSDPADKRVAGHPGAAATPREFMDAAEAIQRETGSHGAEAGRIRVLAIELAGVQDRLRNYRLNGFPESDYRVKATRERLADGMPKLRSLYGELAKVAKPEAVGVDKMAGRMDDPGVVVNDLNAVIQGTADQLLDYPENVVIDFYKEVYRMEKRFDRIDQGENWQIFVAEEWVFEAMGTPGVAAEILLALFNGEDPTALMPKLFDVNMIVGGIPLADIVTVAYGMAGANTRELMKDAMAIGPVMEFPPMRTITDARAWIKQEFERNPKLKGTLSDRLAYGTGRALPALMVAIVMKKGGWLKGGLSARTIGAIDAAMAEGVDRFHESLDNGDGIEQAFIKHDLGMWFGGIVEYAQLPRLFSVADKEVKGQIKNILVNAAESGAQGLVKQTFHKIWRLVQDRYVITDDPDGDRHTVELPDGPVVVSTKAMEQMVALLAGL